MRAELVELKRRIDGLVTKAFDRCFIRCDETWAVVDGIDLDYGSGDEYDDLPIIMVDVRFFNGKVMENPVSLNLAIYPDMSDDYNIGHLASAFEREESDE